MSSIRVFEYIFSTQLSVALFAHRVFVVEGTTESSAFYGVGDRTLPGSLEAAGISIVDANGKSSIPLVHAILTSIGIPAYALFDADNGFESRAKVKGKEVDKIEEERVKHVKDNRKILRYFSLTEVDFPSAMVADNVAIFDDNLESFMSANWAEWTTACNIVEDEAGISLAKNQLAYRTATLKANGVVPDMLVNILAKVKGI